MIYYVSDCKCLSRTGYTGEFGYEIRSKIMEQIACLGLKLNDGRNKECFGKRGVITTDDSPLKAVVMPTNEELMIAESAVEVLGK